MRTCPFFMLVTSFLAFWHIFTCVTITMTIGPTFFHDAPTLPHILRHESTYRQDLHATTMTMPLIDVVYVSCRIHKIGIAVSPLAIKGHTFRPSITVATSKHHSSTYEEYLAI